MISSSRIDEISQRLSDELGSHISKITTNFRGRIRISFGEGKFLDIRYPRDDSYSFHFQSMDNEYRIDCAPHHNSLGTFPNHFHKNDDILDDRWTDPQNSLSENLEGLANWIKDEILPLL